MANPYNPKSPAKPHFFGGRHHIIASARESFDEALTYRRSGGVLVYGHRGVGKTSLLKKILSLVQSSEEEKYLNALVLDRRLSRTTSDQELYQILNEELYAQVSDRGTAVEKLKSKAKSIRGVSLFQLGFNFKEESERRSPYQLWRASVRELKNADFILIAIDDADYLSPEALSELKTIVEDENATPIILLVSGGVGFEERLVDEYSPVARIFSGSSFNIGKLTIEETGEVLQKPLEDSSASWKEEGINELYRLTSGYPYLVQCLAHACYEEGEAISESKVGESIMRAVEIGKSWLDHEIPQASDLDVVSFAQLIKIESEVFQSSEINHVGVAPIYIGRLVKLGVLKKVRRGRYSLQKSPMIAIYEKLKRGISDEKI